VPVSVNVAIDRQLPDSAEVGAYYVVAEALTNAAKHAPTAEVEVSAQANDEYLYLSIRDNGIGGADFRNGTGLIGLMDRVDALGGCMTVVSPPGNGTSLDVTIPIG
jgi:signal transduction histidine kinase